MSIELRKKVWEDTIKICKNYDPVIKSIKEFYKDEKIKTGNNIINLYESDTIDVALTKTNPLVLVFGDDLVPGGCIWSNNGMQEESIFRRTAIHKHLLPYYYPILNNEALYCPNVPVFRASEQHNYIPINPVNMCFIVCPGLKDVSMNYTEEQKKILENKIKLIFQVANKYGHTNIILGALGCGVYGCNIKETAKIFRNVIDNVSNFDISFAILGKNYHIFKDIILG